MNVLTHILTGRILIIVGFLYGWSHQVTAQERDPQAIREEDVQRLNDQRIAVTHWTPSANALAENLLQSYELVAVGQFVEVPSSDRMREAALQPTDAQVTFRPSRVYKGENLERVSIQLSTDMLKFPDTDISAYAWRQQLRKEQIAERQEIDRRLAGLERDRSGGAITEDAYEREKTQLDAARDALLNLSLRSSTRQVAAIDAETFHDLNGVIATGQTYVIGANRVAGQATYLLEELSRSGVNVFWGEPAQEVQSALDSRRAAR